LPSAVAGGTPARAAASAETFPATANPPRAQLDAPQARLARQRFIDAATGAATLPHGQIFLFYNVHEYTNPFGEARGRAIVNLVAEARADYIGLAESSPDSMAHKALAPFPHSLITDNGGTRLAVAWRDPTATATVVPTTGTRNCILLTTRGLRIAVVHLEIGIRPLPHNKNPAIAAYNQATCANNANERIHQLELLVARSPDMLIGDFNFEPGEPEDVWMHTHGYHLVSGHENSTPFNRVDHCYVRASCAHAYCPDDSVLLSVAHSDHRPLAQAVKFSA
jgi:endonuclease/exonuclease/phosphatase family metal-dependent hydrolase